MDLEMHDMFFSILGYAGGGGRENVLYCNIQQYIQEFRNSYGSFGVFFSKNTYLLKYIRGINILCKISHLKTKKSYAILVSLCLHTLNLKILNLCIRRIFVHVHMHIHTHVHVTVFNSVNELFV